MNQTEPMLSPMCKKALDQLKAIDIDELVEFVSAPATNKSDRDRKMKGFLLLAEALESLRFAQLQIK